MLRALESGGGTCGPASLMSFTLNGDEVGQWLLEPSMSPSSGLEMSLINNLIFLFCLPHWSEKEKPIIKHISFHLHTLPFTRPTPPKVQPQMEGAKTKAV